LVKAFEDSENKEEQLSIALRIRIAH